MSRLSFPVDARNAEAGDDMRAAPPSNTADRVNATPSPSRVATTPQRYEPTACDPVKTSRYIDNPRARTQRGK